VKIHAPLGSPCKATLVGYVLLRFDRWQLILSVFGKPFKTELDQSGNDLAVLLEPNRVVLEVEGK